MNALIAEKDFGHSKKVLDMREIVTSYRGKEISIYEYAKKLAFFSEHEGLMNHIKENGLKNPIAVVEKDEKYYFAFSYARVQCAIKLGYTHIDCIILKDEKDVIPLKIEQAKTAKDNYCMYPGMLWFEKKEPEGSISNFN